VCGKNVPPGNSYSGSCVQLPLHCEVCKLAVLITARLNCSELKFAKLHNLL